MSGGAVRIPNTYKGKLMSLKETLKAACAYSHNYIVRGGDWRDILAVIEAAIHTKADEHLRAGRLAEYQELTAQAESIGAMAEPAI